MRFPTTRTLAILAAPLLFAGAAHAQGALTSAETSFVQQAAAGGMAEVEAGQLAESKAQSTKVKAFAQHMVQEHTANNKLLMGIAQSKGVTLPPSSDATHEAQIAKLRDQSGATFDRNYIAAQVTGHQQMEQLLRTELSSGADPDLKAYAQKTLPAVQQHLQLARQLAKG